MVAEVGLGAMDTPTSRAGAETIAAAIELGINFIDTARDYSGSEFLIGQVLRERPGTDLFLCSKTFSRTINGSQRDVDRSLSVLGRERLALYMLHDVSTRKAWRQVVSAGGALEGLRIARQRGLVGFLGLSSHDPEVLETAVRSGEFDAVMVEYSAFYPESAPLIDLAAARDVGVIVMRPLGGSGRASVIRTQAANGYEGSLTHANLLRYVLSNPGVAVAIPGARFPSRVAENVRTALSMTPMTGSEKAELEAEARALY